MKLKKDEEEEDFSLPYTVLIYFLHKMNIVVTLYHLNLFIIMKSYLRRK